MKFGEKKTGFHPVVYELICLKLVVIELYSFIPAVMALTLIQDHRGTHNKQHSLSCMSFFSLRHILYMPLHHADLMEFTSTLFSVINM